jgi:hypothetical protein
MLTFVPSIIASGKVPTQLLGYVHFPAWVFRFQITASIGNFIGSFNNLWISILTFFVLLLLITAVTSLVYAVLYTVVGPARYSPLDAPPPKYKGKKYTR